MPIAWSLPEAPAFEILDTEQTGRAVFSRTSHDPGSIILTTTPEHSPLAHVILRTYRKEVCALCFAYDRGREWKIRNTAQGTVFCSPDCQEIWNNQLDAVSEQALVATETFATALLRKLNRGRDQTAATSISHSYTTEVDVSNAWAAAEAQAVQIRNARKSDQLSKAQRKVLQAILTMSVDLDILAYVLYGVLAAYGNAKLLANKCSVASCQDLLPSLFQLVPDAAVFISNPMTETPLQDYTTSYLILLAILPIELVCCVSGEMVQNLASRASHNAFSIRPVGNTDGDQSGEFMGWGVWPEASFFNHSCSPNVHKIRSGRLWSFNVAPDIAVAAGDQLCITYLGGDEKDLNVAERRKRLTAQWGFLCLCSRCVAESTSSDGRMDA